MSIQNFIKRVQAIMRRVPGLDGDAQRIFQLVWLIFLFVYDAREMIWEDEAEDIGENYKSIIPEELRWRNWAIDLKDGKALTGESLINFIDNDLFPILSSLEVTERTPKRRAIVRSAMEGLFNYMKDGVLLREIVNIINEINIHDYKKVTLSMTFMKRYLKISKVLGIVGSFIYD